MPGSPGTAGTHPAASCEVLESRCNTGESLHCNTDSAEQSTVRGAHTLWLRPAPVLCRRLSSCLCAPLQPLKCSPEHVHVQLSYVEATQVAAGKEVQQRGREALETGAVLHVCIADIVHPCCVSRYGDAYQVVTSSKLGFQLGVHVTGLASHYSFNVPV